MWQKTDYFNGGCTGVKIIVIFYIILCYTRAINLYIKNSIKKCIAVSSKQTPLKLNPNISSPKVMNY